MAIVNNIFLLLCGILLAACATKWEVPHFQAFNQKTFSLNCDNKSYILQVNDEPHFALFDGLFVLVVSKKIENSYFINTKFLPPNSMFDEIFIGILDMIKNDKKASVLKSKTLICEVKEI